LRIEEFWQILTKLYTFCETLLWNTQYQLLHYCMTIITVPFSFWLLRSLLVISKEYEYWISFSSVFLFLIKILVSWNWRIS
jgi:hypothetical protein